MLSFFAWVIGILGVLAVLVAILAAFSAMVQAADRSLDSGNKTFLVSVTAACLVYGIGCIVAGVFLNMQASLALAVRDIARNSFRRGD